MVFVIYCFGFGIYTNQPINYWTVTSNWAFSTIQSSAFIWPIYFFPSFAKHLNCSVHFIADAWAYPDQSQLSDETMRFHVVTFIFTTQKPNAMPINSIRIKIFSGIFAFEKRMVIFFARSSKRNRRALDHIKQTFRNDGAQLKIKGFVNFWVWNKINTNKWANTIIWLCTAGSNWKGER